MNKITSSNQYFFNFQRDLNASLDNFYFSKKNKILKNELDLFINDSHTQNLFISGGKGLGKTFLMNCALNDKNFRDKKCLYIDIKNLNDNVKVFKEIDSFSVICIDNIHHSSKDIEVELFNLANKAFASNIKLLISSQLHISQLNLFPDLLSRIKQMSCFSIEQISDDEVDDVINFMNLKLKLFFPKDIIEDISKIVRRDISSIKDLFVELEQFLYSEKRKPSKRTIMSYLKKTINR
jgi:chromosomal replication initiation ATPase DnaA